MKKSIAGKAAALLLAGVLAVSASPAVSADSTYYIYIDKPGTLIYTGAGFGYRTRGSVPKPGRINLLGTAVDAEGTVWYNVGSIASNGWVSSADASRYYKSGTAAKKVLGSRPSTDHSAYLDISAQIYDSAKDAGAIGIQAAVIRGSDSEEFCWELGDAEIGSTAMTADAKLSAGAVSETVAAAAAAKLQESGSLSLTGSIKKHWGIRPANPLSLAMLLTHSSGLLQCPIPADISGTADMLAGSGSFSTTEKPGTTAGWRSNPTGIAVAAATIELAANDTLENYAKDNLFTPIGADLSFFPGALGDTGSLASMYGEGVKVELLRSEGMKILPTGVIGADQTDFTAGLTGSARDIAKFFSMLANDGKAGDTQVLSAASVASLEKKFFTVTENGASFRQCVGMRYQAKMYGTSGLYYQTGCKNGILTFASYDPKTKNTVVVMASGAAQEYDGSGIYKVCGDIASKIYGVLGSKDVTLYKYPTLKGAGLRPGDTIGVVATSYYIRDNAYTKAVNYLKNEGYNVEIAPSVTARYRFYAGTDKQRAKDINAFFEDDGIDAILCLHGGNGAAGVLPYLDYDMIAKHPKLFIGYSDVTALHVALAEKSGITTIHGPMLSSFVSSVYRYTSEQFLGGITNTDPIGEVELPGNMELKPVVQGSAEGKIVGGNLTVLASLAGTEYELQGDHCLLFIEETGEYASSIDRKLRQLEMNGLFDRVDGIIFGTFTSCPDTDGVTAAQVIDSFAERIGKPTVKNLPAGHSGLNMFLPLGVRARLTVRKSSASLVLLESAAVG